MPQSEALASTWKAKRYESGIVEPAAPMQLRIQVWQSDHQCRKSII